LLDDGRPVSLSGLAVASDPGLWLKYAGSLIVVLGIATMFYMKAYFFRPRVILSPTGFFLFSGLVWSAVIPSPLLFLALFFSCFDLTRLPNKRNKSGEGIAALQTKPQKQEEKTQGRQYTV
jgi:NO-binding membrane sensor protein with MHYT domain